MRKPSRLAWSCLLATALAAAALATALSLSPQQKLSERYLNLCQWDCIWYQSIASTGYHSPVPPIRQRPEISNVAFFPGYPILARALFLPLEALGMQEAKVPLLLVSQAACVAFWLALLLILARWRVRPEIQALVLTAILAHPAAFYLVLGYSESLFLASMLFYFYWADDPRADRRWWAAAAGFVMTATRIVGVPVALYPLIRWLASQRSLRRPDWRSARQPATLAAVSSLGCLLFLAYCQWRFGDFGLYADAKNRLGHRARLRCHPRLGRL